jgi:hypothetical protein
MKMKKIGKDLYKNKQGVFKGILINSRMYGKYASNSKYDDEYFFGIIVGSKYFDGELKKKDINAPVLNYLVGDFEGNCKKGYIENGKVKYYDNHFSIIKNGVVFFNSFD